MSEIYQNLPIGGTFELDGKTYNDAYARQIHRYERFVDDEYDGWYSDAILW